MGNKITCIPVRAKDNKPVIKEVLPVYTDCRHLRAEVDESLAELTCADCKEKLNPIKYLATLARQETRWGYEAENIKKLREELDKRKRCICTKCGEWTQIKSVSVWEMERIRKQATPNTTGEG